MTIALRDGLVVRLGARRAVLVTGETQRLEMELLCEQLLLIAARVWGRLMFILDCTNLRLLLIE